MYIDLLIQLKNAQAVKKRSIKIRFSRMDKAISEVLKKAGFLKKVDVKGRMPKRILELTLNTKERPIQGVKFLSRPSLRQYFGYRDLRNVKGGYGTLVLSTPEGILTASEARKKKVGGQALFEIW